MWRKCYLWLISLAGTGICIAVLAAALAPSPGNHIRPIGGVLGVPALIFSIWIGWYAHCVPLGSVRAEGSPTNSSAIEHARARIRLREECRQLALRDPRLAFELAIGRPDLPRQFDDGGLIDVNRAPAGALASLPDIDADLAGQIVTMRRDIGGFSSADDVEVLLRLAPSQLDTARHFMIF